MALLLPACHQLPHPPTPLAQDLPVPTSLTHRRLPDRVKREPFSFLVAGHLYGDPEKLSMPAASFRGAIAPLAKSGSDMLICCGDTFRRSTPKCFDLTVEQLWHLPFPTFNAVGNHDVSNLNEYTDHFGNTYGAFAHAGCAFILLDTERSPWQIEGAQLEFLAKAVDNIMARDDIRAVFCFAHKLIFAHRQKYFDVLLGSNALDSLSAPSRFVQDVLPLLSKAAKRTPLYWFGGDIGVQHTLSAFYDHDETTGITFAATGIGDLPRDSVIKVAVDDSDIRLSLVPLTVHGDDQLSEQGMEVWTSRIESTGLSAKLEVFRALLPK
jgi:hypothetical protein